MADAFRVTDLRIQLKPDSGELENSGGFRRIQENSGGFRRIQENSGGFRRIQENSGEFRSC